VKAPKVQPSDDAIQVKAAMEYLVTGHGSMGPAIALANRSMQARLDEVMP
jgi:2-keto-3-deoxy-L-rhamnonate aldolase RhmA